MKDFIKELSKFAIRSIKIIIKALIGLFALFLLFHLVMYIIDPYSAEKDSCMYDSYGSWDDSEKRCREDCVRWEEKYGCIKITEQQIKQRNKYLKENKTVPAALRKEICLQNQKAWNFKKEECYFDFIPADCSKLGDSWQYPDICSDKK